MMTIISVIGLTVLIFAITALYTMDDSANKYVSGLQSGAQAGVKGLAYILLVYIPIFLLIIGVGLAYMEWLGFETGIPEQIVPYYVQTLILSPIAILLAVISILVVDDSNGELVNLLEPETGDFAVKEFPPEEWARTTVKEIMKDEDGRLVAKERDKSDLPKATVETKSGMMGTKMRTAHEGLHYDESSKTLYTSFLAGLSPREVRSRKDSLEYIQKVLAWESDRASKLESNFMNITRDAVKTEVNHLIHTIEGVELPNRSLTKSIERAIDDSDVEYLTEKDVEDVDEQVGMENPAKQESVLEQYKNRQTGDSDE